MTDKMADKCEIFNLNFFVIYQKNTLSVLIS